MEPIARTGTRMPRLTRPEAARSRAPGLAWMLALAATSALAQAPSPAPVLNPPAARISDAAIHADYQTYEQVQARIRALNTPQRPLRDYHLAKAQCWLDVSFHEYTRNDRSPFPQQALEQSALLVQGMEAGRADLSMDTPLVNDAERLRPDLWAQADALKGHAGWRCVAPRVACAEVELVHAGNEFRQQGWRHANPYVQIAEDHLAGAQAQAAACVPAPVVAAAPAPAPVPQPVVAAPPLPPPARVAQPLEFQANVLFKHDRHQRDQARALTLERLDAAVARARERGVTLQGVQLVGHADRTGAHGYNEALAARRVQTVRELLIERGIPAGLIRSQVRGDTQPVSDCRGRFASRAEELECLLPNRRVEVNFETLRQP